MFCCNSKDDGGSPVKKSKKIATVDNSFAKKDEGLKIVPIESKQENPAVAVEENSVDGVKAEANTKVNETADDAPTEKAGANTNGAAAVDAAGLESQLEHLKGAEEQKEEIEGTLNEDEFDSLIQVYKQKEKTEFKQAMMGQTASNFTKIDSPKASNNLLLKDFTLKVKGSPRAMKLPKLAEINNRTIIDTKALGQYWKGQENQYYNSDKIFTIEQLKGFVRSNDLVRKEPSNNQEQAVPPVVAPVGQSSSFYQPTQKLSDEIIKMKEKYMKEKTGQ